jgi:hypothetical protein
MKIKISDLETLTEKALLKQGCSDSESEIISHLGGGSCGHLGIVIKKLRITQKSGRNFFEVKYS